MAWTVCQQVLSAYASGSGGMMVKSILVVCIGNICRSPLAEVLFSQHLPNINTISAGLRAVVGHPADPHAIDTATKHRLSIHQHRAKQLTPTMCRHADLILVMERSHIQQVDRIDTVARSKTLLLGYWLEQQEVADPYGRDLSYFEHTFKRVKQAVDAWTKAIRRDEM